MPWRHTIGRCDDCWNPLARNGHLRIKKYWHGVCAQTKTHGMKSKCIRPFNKYIRPWKRLSIPRIVNEWLLAIYDEENANSSAIIPIRKPIITRHKKKSLYKIISPARALTLQRFHHPSMKLVQISTHPRSHQQLIKKSPGVIRQTTTVHRDANYWITTSTSQLCSHY